MDNHPFSRVSLGLYRPLAVGFTLMLVAALAFLSSAPAYADDDDDDGGRGRGRGHEQRDNRHDGNRHDGNRHDGNRHDGNRYNDNRRSDYGHRDGYRNREWRGADRSYTYRPNYPRPYVYSQPVYVPPPVYYAPRPSPGISLFFPLDLR